MQNCTSEFPILLQKDSCTTHLLIWKCHKRRYHCGLEDTLNELQQTFWVIKGQQNAKKVIKNSITCLEQKSKPFRLPPVPPLPTFRVNIDFPFTNTEVDYFGPLFV